MLLLYKLVFVKNGLLQLKIFILPINNNYLKKKKKSVEKNNENV